MRRRHLLAAAIGLFASVFAAACLSPTLPLPPPEAPDSIAMAQELGVWDVRGSCTPGARVLITTQDGTITGREDTDNDGRYLIQIEATLCDSAEVTEVVGGKTSDATFFVVEPVTNGMGDESCPQ